MDNRPIGVFDSGVGGLTVVRELHKLLPGEDILYFGDTGRVPYGTRSRDIIRKYAAQDVHYLMTHDVKAIVAACGTVSSNFFQEDVERLGYQVPYLTIVQPATQEACRRTSGGTIGVIATSAAIQSGAYRREVNAQMPTAQVVGAACPLLVPLAENGMTRPDQPIARLAVEMYLEPLMAQGIDTLILGCTHYPLFYDLIGQVLGETVALVDAGVAAAQAAAEILARDSLLAQPGREGTTRYRVTDTVDNFVTVARHFLGVEPAGQTEYVDLDWIEAQGRAGGREEGRAIPHRHRKE